MKDKYYFYFSIIILVLSLIIYVHTYREKSSNKIKKIPEGTKIIRININTANIEELQKIPDIGRDIASNIIQYRKENGEFNTINDLIKVKGIKNKKLNSIKDFIYVENKNK